jgi:Stage II sporulation protein E (SpoIIE)
MLQATDIEPHASGDSAMHQQVEELLLLQRVAQRIGSTLDLEVLLKQIVSDVEETFGYCRSAVLLKDDATDELVITHGWTGDHKRNCRSLESREPGAARRFSNGSIRHDGLRTVDPEERSVVLANAGHLPPLLVEATGAPFLENTGGFPLGLLEGSFSERTIRMSPGSRLVLFSDGVAEALNSSLEEYGLARIQVRRSPAARRQETSNAFRKQVRHS